MFQIFLSRHLGEVEFPDRIKPVSVVPSLWVPSVVRIGLIWAICPQICLVPRSEKSSLKPRDPGLSVLRNPLSCLAQVKRFCFPEARKAWSRSPRN
jgi:hypothetical protein